MGLSATPIEGFDVFAWSPAYDHVRVAQLFVDEFGMEVMSQSISGSSVIDELSDQIQPCIDPRGSFDGTHTRVSDEFADEVAWLCVILRDGIKQQEQNIKRLSLYNEDHRYLMAFVIRPIMQSFEPTQELATILDVPPSSLSRWASGKARPQKIVRKALRERLLLLTQASLGALLELDAWLTRLMGNVGLDRDALEAEVQRELDAIDAITTETANVVVFGQRQRKRR